MFTLPRPAASRVRVLHRNDFAAGLRFKSPMAAASRLPMCSDARLQRLPRRMADFALWVAACETTFCCSGSFERVGWCHRRAAAEEVVDADPVAAGVRDLMTEAEGWTGSASDLLRALNRRRQAVEEISSPGWPRSPRALAGRLRRAQTLLRTLGVEITFRREGQLGARIHSNHWPR